MKIMRYATATLLAAILVFSQIASCAQTYTAEVKDASSRAYYSSVYPLIDNAKESIYAGMYIIVPGTSPTNPVNRLLDALARAAKRGVRVRICLNTKPTYRYDPSDIPSKPWIKGLQESGIEVIFADPARSLHAKVIVIDEEIVVDGSTNWTEASFDYNFESATIIYSKDLARDKKKLLDEVALYADAQRKESTLFAYPLPDKIYLPRAFIQEKKLLAKMNAKRAERAIKLYILIQYIFQGYPQAERRDGVALNIDLCAPYIGISGEWTRVNARRQVIKVLRSLVSEFPLIEVKFHHSKPAWVKPLELGQEEIVIDKSRLGPEELKTLSRKEIVEILNASKTTTLTPAK